MFAIIRGKQVMEDYIKEFLENVKVWYNTCNSWICINKEDLEKSDGRKKDAPLFSRKGSFVYVAYDVDDLVLYVGETGVSVKTRFCGDGSGAHKNKEWYKNMTKIKYLCNENFTEKHRKMLEQTLSIILEPKYYNNIKMSRKT